MSGLIFVSRYKYGHDKKRKLYRRLWKEGKAIMVDQDQSGWYYKLIGEKAA